MEIPARVRSRKTVSPFLEIIRIAPQDSRTPLPRFEAGQALEIIAPGGKMVRRVAGERYVYERNADGTVATGRMAQWYSIASSPEEAAADGVLEFFVGLHDVDGADPRFLLDEPLWYGDQPRGDFTLAARVRDARTVIIAATGTGIAPVVSMIKHLHATVRAGAPARPSVTLFHGHRTFVELGYADDLLAVERSQAFDFVYLPMLTRAPAKELPAIGLGRVTGAVRSVLGPDVNVRFPAAHPVEELRRRMRDRDAVILACGGSAMLQEMGLIAAEAGIRFEQEGW